MRILILFALTGYAFGCECTVNSGQLDGILDVVIEQTDVDSDGYITVDEFKQELLSLFDENNDEILRKEEFVHKWSEMHQECEEIAEQFFDNMDKLKDGRLTELDLLLQLNELDFNDDLDVSVAELRSFFHLKHPCGYT